MCIAVVFGATFAAGRVGLTRERVHPGFAAPPPTPPSSRYTNGRIYIYIYIYIFIYICVCVCVCV